MELWLGTENNQLTVWKPIEDHRPALSTSLDNGTKLGMLSLF